MFLSGRLLLALLLRHQLIGKESLTCFYVCMSQGLPVHPGLKASYYVPYYPILTGIPRPSGPAYLSYFTTLQIYPIRRKNRHSPLSRACARRSSLIRFQFKKHTDFETCKMYINLRKAKVINILACPFNGTVA